MKTLLIALLLATTGCASSSRVSGTDSAVVVIWASLPEALPMAEAHCTKFGKHAKYAGSPHPYELIFNCVP